jgi:hypothetical protein
MHSRPYLGPPDPWFRVKARFRRSRPDQVDNCEGVLHLLYNKICLKIIDHGSKSTWGPGPSRSGRVKARSTRSRPDQVDYWEGVLHLLYYKICLKMIDHDSRSTWGPGPSRSGLWDKKYDSPLLNQTFPTTLVL